MNCLTNGGASKEWGGSKYPEAVVYAGAFNYVTTEQILSHVGEVPWVHPESVQVFIQEQEDASFSVWERRGGDWLRVVEGKREY